MIYFGHGMPPVDEVRQRALLYQALDCIPMTTDEVELIDYLAEMPGQLFDTFLSLIKRLRCK